MVFSFCFISFVAIVAHFPAKLGNTAETRIQRRVVFLKNREIPRAEGGINVERKAVGCCLRPRSVQKANQPQGQFLAYGKRNLTIYLEISLTLSVLNGVAGGQLIDNETFTKGAYPE
jgi:hypothetical protein